MINTKTMSNRLCGSTGLYFLILACMVKHCLLSGMVALPENQGKAKNYLKKGGVVCDAREQGLLDSTFLSTLTSLTSVQKLDVSNNFIADFNIKELYRALPGLRTLNISGNNLVKLRTHMLDGLKSGSSLDLSNNPLQFTSKKTLRYFGKLADKKITIRLYDTLLPQDVLKKMESAIANSSCTHRMLQLGTLTVGLLLFVGSIALKALSDSPDYKNQSYLKPLAICVYVAGIVLMAIQPCMGIILHDIKQSRLFWCKTV